MPAFLKRMTGETAEGRAEQRRREMPEDSDSEPEGAVCASLSASHLHSQFSLKKKWSADTSCKWCFVPGVCTVWGSAF
jgi:hypothetical protein